MNRTNEAGQTTEHTQTERRKALDSHASITEAQLQIADQNNALKAIRIEKVGEVHHLYVQLTWRKEELVLTTTRTSVKPREFKHFGRLVEYVEKTCLSVKSFTVHIGDSGRLNHRSH